MTTVDVHPTRESIERIEELAKSAESLPDPLARSVALQLAQGIMALHAEALARTVVILAAGGTMNSLATDELVGGVLAMHGLHPDDAETRVRRAVERLRGHFAGIALEDAGPDWARVRVTGTRPGTAAAARRAIEDAIYMAAPEIARLEIEAPDGPRDSMFVPLESLLARPRA